MTKHIADLFCGAGGTSTGAIRAALRLGHAIDMLAVNHWPTAVKTHELNHPQVRHLCADLNAIDPLKVSRKLDLLCASPECTHHSNARGGKPCDDQSRASAWHVLHWIDKTKPEHLFLENVKEWEDWGPLLDAGIKYRGKYYGKGRPDPRRKGALFNQFVNSVQALGYSLEFRRINAADFGDPTSRIRLIGMGRRGGKEILWPRQSHTDRPFGTLKKWRAAREVIDWDLKGTSIYDRKKPLKPNTLRRIMVGMKKFNGPFLVKLYGTNNVADLENPMPTVTAGGNHIGLCQPFLIHATHHGERKIHSVQDPVPTVTAAKRGELALIEPFIVQLDHTKAGDERKAHDVSKPMPTVTTADAWGLAEPFICKYYGTGTVSSVEEPLDTVTTKDRFLLIMPDGKEARLDIRFRMLQPHELAGAMGFPSDYKFDGNREQRVKQIGNAVPVNLADAHCGAALSV
jgi:DNA (cytosine-5)-methyltransferase 1